MKKFVILFALVLAALTAGTFAHAGPPDTPFPLDYPVKFPWNAIEGIWQVTNTNADYVFSFQVQSDCEGQQILKVYQLNPVTDEVVAEGIGYKNDDSFEVYAAMKGNNSDAYVLHIGAYKDTHSAVQKRIVILRMMPFSGEHPESDYRIVKQQGRAPIGLSAGCPTN